MRMISLPEAPTRPHTSPISPQTRVRYFPPSAFPSMQMRCALISFAASRLVASAYANARGSPARHFPVRRHHKDATGVEHLAIVKPSACDAAPVPRELL